MSRFPLFAAAFLLACEPVPTEDNTDTDAPASTDTETPTDEASDDETDAPTGDQDLTGTWLSAGDDVSDLLVGFGFVEITATFNADRSYEVVGESANATYTFTGTYSVDTSTSPATIELSQAEPFASASVGIWEVDGDTLTYEVAQTVPDQGFTPPTPETGFGSTAGGGTAPGANVQIYRKQ